MLDCVSVALASCSISLVLRLTGSFSDALVLFDLLSPSNHSYLQCMCSVALVARVCP